MYLIESKIVRELLEMRIKCLRATGNTEAADGLLLDLREITSHEIFIRCDIEPASRKYG